MEVRSYRAVFDLERRIYRVDTVRLNPGGIPLRGIAYASAIAVVIAAAGSLPVLGGMLGAVPWYLRLLGMPVAVAAALTVARVDGRPAHVVIRALVRHGLRRRALSGLRPCQPLGRRWRPGPIAFLPDGSDCRFRALRYTGPGVVQVCLEHRRTVWRVGGAGRRLGADVMVETGGRARRLRRPSYIELAPGRVLRVRTGG